MKSRVTVAIYASFILLIVLAITVLGPFLLSLTLGAAFGVALLPVKEKICSVVGVGNKVCSTLVCTLFALFVLTPMIFATWSLVKRVQQNPNIEKTVGSFEQKTTVAISQSAQLVGNKLDKESIRNFVTKTREKARLWLQASATGFLASLFDLSVHFLMILLAMFLVLTGYRNMIGKMSESHFFSNYMVTRGDSILSAACKDVFFSNIITGLLQSLMVAIGIGIFTDFDPYLTFVFTFIVSFIPIVGAAPVAAAAAIFQVVEQDYQSAAALAGISLLVGVSDNIVRALLMSHDKEDNAVVNLLACIGGIYVWGLPGLFIGPLVVTLAIKMTPLFFDELRRQPTPSDNPSAEHKELVLVESHVVS